MLGEPGLRHWATEFQLPTGDTVDVVLMDENGRFVVVEVEVDCDASEVVGPLQCMKYRAMVSYLFKRHPSEVRAILIAHSIHDDVVSWCAEYEVESKLQPRKAS
jgi:RecB family endonuclease NucS